MTHLVLAAQPHGPSHLLGADTARLEPGPWTPALQRTTCSYGWKCHLPFAQATLRQAS